MSSLELKGLKGLRNLSGLTNDASFDALSNEQIERLPVELLCSGKYQPRKNFDETVLNELADSIKTQGIIQPIIVRKTGSNRYEIIAGERRWRAAQIAGMSHIPAIVRRIEDNVAFAFSIIENIQRQDLNPIEEALAFSRFCDEFSMTHEEISKMVGRSRAYVSNTLRLLMLEPEVIDLVQENKIDMGHARALLALNSEEQIQTASMIIDKGLSVRETEKIIKKINVERQTKKNGSEVSGYQDQSQRWANELSKLFATHVSVNLNNHGIGNIVIKVNSPEEVEWITTLVTKNVSI